MQLPRHAPWLHFLATPCVTPWLQSSSRSSAVGLLALSQSLRIRIVVGARSLVVCALLASGSLAALCGVGLPAQLLAGCLLTCACCLLTRLPVSPSFTRLAAVTSINRQLIFTLARMDQFRSTFHLTELSRAPSHGCCIRDYDRPRAAHGVVLYGIECRTLSVQCWPLDPLLCAAAGLFALRARDSLTALRNVARAPLVHTTGSLFSVGAVYAFVVSVRDVLCCFTDHH